jgi:hypothetical protein
LSARARAADVGQILETLCAVRKTQRGPSSAKATAGQANAEGKFLPWCFGSKPLAVRGLAAKKRFFAVFSGMTCGQEATGIMAPGAQEASKSMSSAAKDKGVAL